MKILIEISDERIKDAIVTALEGGSNYWAFVNTDKSHIPLKVEGSLAEHIASSVMSDSDYHVVIEDIATGELLGVLSYASIEEGLRLLCIDYPEKVAEMIDHLDAGDADIFFQLCVMGELVFG